MGPGVGFPPRECQLRGEAVPLAVPGTQKEPNQYSSKKFILKPCKC